MTYYDELGTCGSVVITHVGREFDVYEYRCEWCGKEELR